MFHLFVFPPNAGYPQPPIHQPCSSSLFSTEGIKVPTKHLNLDLPSLQLEWYHCWFAKVLSTWYTCPIRRGGKSMGGKPTVPKKTPRIYHIRYWFATSRIIPITNKNKYPPGELTSPTSGKGTSSSKCHFWGDMLVPWRVVHCEPNLKCWSPVFI